MDNINLKMNDNNEINENNDNTILSVVISEMYSKTICH